MAALDESSLVAITDTHGTLKYVNKKFCSVSGYTAEELVGKNHRIVKSGFLPSEFYRDLWTTISGGDIWHGEMKNKTKHGKNFWVATTIVPFVDGSGLPEQFVAISTDLTSQKNTEESLMDANMQLRRTANIQKENMDLHLEFEKLMERDTLKEEFSAMITHELKTPLVPILGYCKMLRSSMLGRLPDEAVEAVEVIEKNAKRLEELIGDIMDSRKLDMGKMRFKFENMRLREFFEMLDKSYNEVLRNRGIRFVARPDFGDPVVNVDRDRLRQVFDNIISNSIKFVPEENGIIEIGGYDGKEGLVLYVRDNGIGIPKDKQKDLFKKFYQVDTSERRASGGSGLGLAISKGIIENMGGRIWAESDGISGTAIFLTLNQIRV